jgi:hypothetical protein
VRESRQLSEREHGSSLVFAAWSDGERGEWVSNERVRRAPRFDCRA